MPNLILVDLKSHSNLLYWVSLMRTCCMACFSSDHPPGFLSLHGVIVLYHPTAEHRSLTPLCCKTCGYMDRYLVRAV